jgi:hypothetical protein
MEIGEAIKLLKEGKLVHRTNMSSSKYLKMIDGTIIMFVIKHGTVWNPKQEDLLAHDYKLYNVI